MISRTAPLTFGQLSVWRINETYPVSRWSETYLRRTARLPGGCTVDQVLAAVATVCARHEALRTHFVVGAAGLCQLVRPAGREVRVEVVERSPVTPLVADAVADALAADRIDPAEEFGVRFAVLTEGAAPVLLAVVVDHLVADGTGLRRVCAEVVAALGGDDPEGGRWLAQRPPQPVDLAAEQRGGSGLRRAEAALDHWRALLRDVPPEVFPLPRPRTDEPGRVEAILTSSSGRHNLAAAAAATGVSPQDVLLALTAVATAVVVGSDRVVLTLQSGNRFGGRWHSIVSSMNQYAPLLVDLGPGHVGFADFAEALHSATLKAYRAGSYDVDAVTDLVRRERGIDLGFDNFFNFMAHDVDKRHEVTAVPARGVVTDTEPNRQIGPRLDVKVRSGPDLPVVVRTDPRLLPRPALRALLGWYDDQVHRVATGRVTVGELVNDCARALGRGARA
ncbi:condensation domain-containing protein [Actinokineospora globicatena]|uniref:condensation domain-containing protein n=1 Tax=Actinokineospora globicatena TaxID=103729 RepID=UPI0031E2F38A